MQIQLPGFEKSFCYAIVACAHIKTKSKSILARLSSGKLYHTAYTRNGKAIYALAILGGGDHGAGGNHLHVEVTSRKPANYEETKSEYLEEGDFQSLIGEFVGKQMDVVVTGHFLVQSSKLPRDCLVRPRFFSIGEDPYEIRTIRMDFEFKGAVFPDLSWKAFGSDGMLAMELSGRLQGKLASEYLVEFLRYLDDSYQVYVLGKKPNA